MTNADDDLSAPQRLRHWIQFPVRQKIAIALWFAEIIAFVLMLIALFQEVKSILYIGPIFAVVGYAFALAGWPLHSWRVLSFGLLAPLMIASASSVFILIPYGPHAIQQLLALLLLIGGLAFLPLAAAVFHRITSPPDALGVNRWLLAVPWQFSLKSLLAMTTGIALLLLLARWIFVALHGLVIPVGFTVINFMLCGILIQWFAIRYRP